MADRLVIGIGNRDRGDDGVGRLVARMLRGRAPPDVRLIEHDGEATSLLATMRTADHVWLIDAVCSGGPVGRLHRIDCAATGIALPVGTMSSHGLGVAEAVALGRVLGILPRRCILLAVEAAEFDAGLLPSPEVTDAARDLVEGILQELRLP